MYTCVNNMCVRVCMHCISNVYTHGRMFEKNTFVTPDTPTIHKWLQHIMDILQYCVGENAHFRQVPAIYSDFHTL